MINNEPSLDLPKEKKQLEEEPIRMEAILKSYLSVKQIASLYDIVKESS